MFVIIGLILGSSREGSNVIIETMVRDNNIL